MNPSLVTAVLLAIPLLVPALALAQAQVSDTTPAARRALDALPPHYADVFASNQTRTYLVRTVVEGDAAAPNAAPTTATCTSGRVAIEDDVYEIEIRCEPPISLDGTYLANSQGIFRLEAAAPGADRVAVYLHDGEPGNRSNFTATNGVTSRRVSEMSPAGEACVEFSTEIDGRRDETRLCMAEGLGITQFYRAWSGPDAQGNARETGGADAVLIDAADPLNEVVSNTMIGELEAAVDALEVALDAGYATPMGVLTDRRLRALVEEPTSRARLRELMRVHARESRADLVVARATDIQLTVRVVDADGSAPVPGARVSLVHTNPEGSYGEDGSWNPFIFGTLIADENGHVGVATRRPGAYPEDGADTPGPIHIHFDVQAEGYVNRAAEFLFSTDPLLTDEARAEALTEGLPVADCSQGFVGWTCTVVLAIERGP